MQRIKEFWLCNCGKDGWYLSEAKIENFDFHLVERSLYDQSVKDCHQWREEAETLERKNCVLRKKLRENKNGPGNKI